MSYEFKGTPGPWQQGNQSDSIVNKDITSGDAESREYYGGFVVCESVRSQDRHLIMAAPELLRACINIMNGLHERQGTENEMVIMANEYTEMTRAIAKALNIE